MAAAERGFHPAAGVLAVRTDTKNMTGTIGIRKVNSIYDSGEWNRSRAMVLEADQGCDVYVFMTEGRILDADTVHHIIPLKEDWSKRNCIDNLMSLHHDTHSLIETMYRKDKKKIQKELQQMLMEYRKLVRAGGI